MRSAAGKFALQVAEQRRENESLRLMLRQLARGQLMQDEPIKGVAALCLDKIKEIAAETGRFPTADEIAEAMGWRRKKRAHWALGKLCETGDVIRDESISRGVGRYQLAPKHRVEKKKPKIGNRGTAADAARLAAEKRIPMSEAIKIVGLV